MKDVWSCNPKFITKQRGDATREAMSGKMYGEAVLSYFLPALTHLSKVHLTTAKLEATMLT